MNFLILFLGKSISFASKILNLGNGSTWPGHIALKLDPKFIEKTFKNSNTKIILISGTNGKTTTAKLIETILKNENMKVFTNSSGANLSNGIASALVLNASITGKINKDFAIFEVDENALPKVTKLIEPDYIIALNLFRDQLDRYGELDSISKKWKDAYKELKKTTFILNADDPLIAYLGKYQKSVYYFGLEDKTIGYSSTQHASDSILCPNCSERLTFSTYYFSHLGKWECLNCKLKRPALTISKFSIYPLLGTYSKYNVLASVLLAKKLGISDKKIETALKGFKAPFGRQEEINAYGKKIKMFLSKNPTSFNESLRTINKQNPKNLLIILNDRIPDGTDVSWIWDVDFETLVSNKTKLYLAGDRVYDLALRIKYSGNRNVKDLVFENLEDAIFTGLKNTSISETFYILPTYSAMLEARKYLTGRKIL